MKANELMIGDWVAYRRDFPDRVVGISADGLAVYLKKDNWQALYNIQPVPLTPGVLVYNGFAFVYSSVPGGTPEQQRFRKIDTYKWMDVAINYYHETGDFGFIDIRRGRIKYVHELQHALRICGIEKEIIL